VTEGQLLLPDVWEKPNGHGFSRFSPLHMVHMFSCSTSSIYFVMAFMYVCTYHACMCMCRRVLHHHIIHIDEWKY
jgi:hypothetical protein